jgi:hypothetical protein
MHLKTAPVKIDVDYNTDILRMRDGEYRLLYRIMEVSVLTHGRERGFLIGLAEQTLGRQE